MDARRLEPLSYHRESVAFLKQHEADLWRWMTDGHMKAESEQLRKDLLRSTYRLDRDAHPEVFEAADRAARALEIPVPVSMYQTQFESAPNAALVFVPHEAIVLFAGPMIEMLSSDELASVLGHELAHHRLWTSDGGDHFIVDRLLNAAAANGASAAFVETARRIALSTELFADRGGLLASGSLSATVSALVKSSTGMRSVSAASFLAQADEVVSKDGRIDTGGSHPESFLRAIAVRDWSEGKQVLSQAVDGLLHGVDDVERLDLLGQERLERLTRDVLEELLAPEWMQSDAMIGHARLFFPDIRPAVSVHPSLLVVPPSPATVMYFAYVLLDFATADPELESQAMIEAAAMAHRLGISETFAQLLDRELRMKPKVRTAILADGEVRSIELSAGISGALQ